MRMIFSLLLLNATMSACSSGSKPTPTDEASSPSVNQDGDNSQVLATKKCPKHGRMVNGKCTLQVESDDE